MIISQNVQTYSFVDTAPNAYRQCQAQNSTLSFELDSGPLRESPNLLNRPPSLQIGLILDCVSTLESTIKQGKVNLRSWTCKVRKQKTYPAAWAEPNNSAALLSCKYKAQYVKSMRFDSIQS